MVVSETDLRPACPHRAYSPYTQGRMVWRGVYKWFWNCSWYYRCVYLHHHFPIINFYQQNNSLPPFLFQQNLNRNSEYKTNISRTAQFLPRKPIAPLILPLRYLLRQPNLTLVSVMISYSPSAMYIAVLHQC